MKITDFLVMNARGDEIMSDTHENHIAFLCAKCGFPILAGTLDHQPGNDDHEPATCRGCGAIYSLDVRMQAKKLYIHPLKKRAS